MRLRMTNPSSRIVDVDLISDLASIGEQQKLTAKITIEEILL